MENLYNIPLPTPFPVGNANSYLVTGKELALIDTGPFMPGVFEALSKKIDDLGFSLRDIKKVFLTHAHIDHFGILNQVVQASGAKVYTHQANVPFLTDYWGDWKRRSDYYVEFYRITGAPPEAVAGVEERYSMVMKWAEGAPVDVALSDGDVVEIGDMPWQVLHTPGHSYGSVCYYQPDKKIMFSGDHLIKHITSNPIAEPPQGDGMERIRSLAQYLDSLKKIENMDIDIMYPGHGEPITNHREIVQKRYKFHQDRKEHIYNVLLKSKATVIYDLAVELFPDISPMEMPLALFEVVGHLDLLETEGRIYYLPEDGIVRICLT